MTFSGEGSPSLSGTLIRNQRHGAPTDTPTHSHVTAVTLLSVVNNGARCGDYRQTTWANTLPAACSTKPTLTGRTATTPMTARPGSGRRAAEEKLSRLKSVSRGR